MVAHPLLGLSRQVAEAGLAFQGVLLLLQGEIAVAIHPLAEMLLLWFCRVPRRTLALNQCRALWGTTGLRQKHHSGRNDA